jgi:RNA polymerase sigma-70 factor, ECF subfamily
MLDGVAADARLSGYQPYWAARAELLARSGDAAGAEYAYQLAIGLEADPVVRRHLQKRRAALLGEGGVRGRASRRA